MRITEDVGNYAAEQGGTKEEAPRQVAAIRPSEFLDIGMGDYPKV